MIFRILKILYYKEGFVYFKIRQGEEDIERYYGAE